MRMTELYVEGNIMRTCNEAKEDVGEDEFVEFYEETVRDEDDGGKELSTRRRRGK